MRNRKQFEGSVGDEMLDRREILRCGVALAGASSLAFGALGRAAAQAGDLGPMDAKTEAKKIAFDRFGKGDKVLLISGFPQTRRSWNRLVPLLSQKFETIPADLPSFGDSGILEAPATTENAGRVFHEFVAGLGTPLHVVAHDFGAWVAYSWALLFKEDFRACSHY
jgi:pimeloyl-ACP methyl ester carboxylesterase